MLETREIIALNIASLRKAARLTQAELAEKINYSDKSVSKWERGLSKPCEEHAEKLVDLLGLAAETQTKRSERVASTFFLL